ncbi:MAG TPA: response regulator [Candidatus Krumholzibacteriaceae bacterium]|nr:response regulator [Candidatus Krumholzibacteriaceae bacterium]
MGFVKGKVLFMDDEKLLRRVVSLMLEGLGVECDVASDGEEAIRKYMEKGAVYGIVILDLNVPGGMGGLEAAEAILKYDPKARIYISTGFSSDPIITDYAKHGLTGAIAKPYTAEELKALMGKEYLIKD